jgi:hypothetical protein
MRVIISGASGLIGTALGASLRSDGHEVVVLVRRPAGAGEIQWDPAQGVLAADVLDGADAVVHLAGAGIGDHRWTDAYKQELIDSRVKTTTLLATTIAASANPPKVLLSGSAIGIWRQRRRDLTSCPQAPASWPTCACSGSRRRSGVAGVRGAPAHGIVLTQGWR